MTAGFRRAPSEEGRTSALRCDEPLHPSPETMSTMYEHGRESFEDFMSEVEAEAQREGPGAVAELERLRRFFAADREGIIRDAQESRP